MYYIKKLGFQELGSPKADGTVSRGKYMLISKNHKGFFPPLSETEKNDTVLIAITLSNSTKKVYCRFVFHNDKFHDSTAKNPRNEYRIYLNEGIDPQHSIFKPNDIAVFEKIDIENDEVSLYKISLFNTKSQYYCKLETIIKEASEQKGGHAVYCENLKFLDDCNSLPNNLETIIPSDVIKDVKEKQDKIKNNIEKENEFTKGAHLFNSVSFRDFVLLGYSNKCAITGEAIRYEYLTNLEAAHIKPKSHDGSFLPCNGIAMSRDIHWAFDKGMFFIDNNYCVRVHEDVKNTPLGGFDSKKINLPSEDFFKPELNYLKYHEERIFGLFKSSGSIKPIKNSN